VKSINWSIATPAAVAGIWPICTVVVPSVAVTVIAVVVLAFTVLVRMRTLPREGAGPPAELNGVPPVLGVVLVLAIVRVVGPAVVVMV
jgi:hypothetical protein